MQTETMQRIIPITVLRITTNRVPHIGRMLVGNNNVKLIPVSMSLGACFLTVMDILSRCISTTEIPIGILCALIGTPFFVYLLKKTRGGGWT